MNVRCAERKNAATTGNEAITEKPVKQKKLALPKKNERQRKNDLPKKNVRLKKHVNLLQKRGQSLKLLHQNFLPLQTVKPLRKKILIHFYQRLFLNGIRFRMQIVMKLKLRILQERLCLLKLLIQTNILFLQVV